MGRWRAEVSLAGRTFTFTDEITPKLVQKINTNVQSRQVSSLDFIIPVPRSIRPFLNSHFVLKNSQIKVFLDDEQVLDGPIESVQIKGNVGDGILTVSPEGEPKVKLDEVKSWPPTSYRVNETTFSIPNTSGIDRFYTVIFGQPGTDDGNSDYTPAVPLLFTTEPGSDPANALWDNPLVTALADNETTFTVVTNLWWDENGVNNETEDLGALPLGDIGIIARDDLLGQEYYYVASNFASVISNTNNDFTTDNVREIFMAFGGNLKGATRSSGRASNIWDIVTTLGAADQNKSIDLRSLQGATYKMQQVILDFYINDQISPSKWLFDNLIPLIEHKLIIDDTGDRYTFRPLIPRPRDKSLIVGKLVEDQNFSVSEDLRMKEGDNVNDIQIAWRYNALTNTYTRSSNSGLVKDQLLGNNVTEHVGIRRSQDLFGVIEHELETDLIYRPWVLNWVVQTIIRERGWPKQTFKIDMLPRNARQMKVGMWVSVSSSKRGWKDRFARIVERVDDEFVSLTLELRDET